MILSERLDEKIRRKKVYVTINGKTESYMSNDFKYHLLLLLPNRQMAYFYDGFTLFTHDGEAIRRYPKASINIDTAIHPDLKYYIAANTSAKNKKVYMTTELSGITIDLKIKKLLIFVSFFVSFF